MKSYTKKSNWRVKIVVLLLAISSICPVYAEDLNPVFDKRQWVLGWSKNNKTSKDIFEEYVLRGETVDNWSELVTIQFFNGLNTKVNLDV